MTRNRWNLVEVEDLKKRSNCKRFSVDNWSSNGFSYVIKKYGNKSCKIFWKLKNVDLGLLYKLSNRPNNLMYTLSNVFQDKIEFSRSLCLLYKQDVFNKRWKFILLKKNKSSFN